jgi:hypothetical protein
MKTAMKAVVLLAVLTAGGALAQDKMSASQKEAVNQVKSMAMKERQWMMDKTKALDAQAAAVMKSANAMTGDNAKALQTQVADLQSTVKALQTQLAKQPMYFDNPTANPLSP